MNESQYTSDSPRTNDPLANILADMSSKLEGIGRLEKKLETATNNFTGELDYLKAELSNLTEARKRDGAELTRLQTSIKGVSNDLQKSEEIQGNIERKVNQIDNATNKNLERIDRLEQNTARLSENLKLLEEREKNRPLGARPKIPEHPANVSLPVRKNLEAARISDDSSLSGNNFSYSDLLARGLDGLKSLNLLREQ